MIFHAHIFIDVSGNCPRSFFCALSPTWTLSHSADVPRWVRVLCVTNIKKTYPKLSAVGLNFTMDMTWERLILLSLSEKRPKNIFQAQGVPANGDWACAPWLQQHSILFWDALYVYVCLCVCWCVCVCVGGYGPAQVASESLSYIAGICKYFWNLTKI